MYNIANICMHTCIFKSVFLQICTTSFIFSKVPTNWTSSYIIFYVASYKFVQVPIWFEFFLFCHWGLKCILPSRIEIHAFHYIAFHYIECICVKTSLIKAKTCMLLFSFCMLCIVQVMYATLYIFLLYLTTNLIYYTASYIFV